MESLELLVHGFGVALTVNHCLLMAVGVLFGILVGVLPGLGPPNGMTMLMPMTLGMEPISAMILLTSMYWGALFGGSTTAILFNIPGEPSSVATTFDGYPMAKNGHPAEALSLAFLSAGIGALVGVAVITAVSNPLAKIAMEFAPADYFCVYMLAFATFIGLGGSAPLKTVVSICIGLAFGMVGMDTISADMRLTFGLPPLMTGINFLVAIVGLFGVGELLLTVEQGLRFEGLHARVSLKEVFKTFLTLPRYWVALVRSSIVGVIMGIMPGGPTAGSMLSYGLAKRFSKRGRNFGKGEPNGVVSPETADHAAGCTAMLPMLALGVPGSATAAVLLGGLTIWGLTPGPMLFIEQKDFVWGLIASIYLGNLMAVVVVLATVPLFAAILRLPFSIISPIVLIVCVLGGYTVSQSTFDLWLMLMFGLIGYAFKKLDYPVAPLVLAMVLGDKMEDAFRQSLLISQGKMNIFVGSTLRMWLVGAAVVLLLMPLLSHLPQLVGKAQRAGTQ